MAIRRTLAQFSDEIVAADIAANAVGASELADNAVDTAAIATNAVTATEIVAGAVTEAKLNADVTDGSAIITGVKPHIITDVLYPAVANVMLDGTTALSAVTTGPNSSTVASSKYGTVQSDGRMYYYTDIKGSKPIKDPRIGSHFGSQRHKFKSMQQLEQETATHGENVYSIDGRNWARAVGDWVYQNGAHGVYLQGDNAGAADFTCYIEYTGYFNRSNFIATSYDDTIMNISIDGVVTSNFTGNDTTVNSPLTGRFVDAGSVINLPFTPTLGIHTVRIGGDSNQLLRLYGIELIAQDTTSTTTKSQIQIPSQNVVSYGKKFTVSGTPHYNPFAFKTDGSTVWASGAHNGTAWPIGTGSSTNIDTATSLGLAAWLHSSNYYKPYNGGRVVKWVANDGTIKTSVNMMPPNARNADGLAVSAKANASIANNTYLPTFEAGAIDYSQSEVAKTFYNREFGNGAANGGTGATYADSSMIKASVTDNTAYVMDDGLTSAVANQTEGYTHGTGANADGFYEYHTFIGTGYTYIMTNGTVLPIAQNLPYGTHIFKKTYVNASSEIAYMDGVQVRAQATHTQQEMSFHQPKMPPIPEDAVVIADYMLMADFVAESATVTQATISKGVRRISASRDWFYNSANAPTFNHAVHTDRSPDFLAVQTHSSSTMTVEIPTFSTRAIVQVEDIDQADHGTTWAGTDTESSNTKVQGTNNSNDIAITPVATLGVNKLIQTVKSAGHQFCGGWVASPIHTSSHYQTFETPFLHELVGGDRNMEQTNLVVTPDGKTWDEVTRDVGYMGPSTQLSCSRDGGHISGSNPFIWDEYRGKDIYPFFNKNIVIAYDRFIILEDGIYEIDVHFYANAVDFQFFVYQNATSGTYTAGVSNRTDPSDTTTSQNIIWDMKRGDYVYINIEVGSTHSTASQANALKITKLN